jgi:radical SAM protein with 4Fe4S-binding SPASM domain
MSAHRFTLRLEADRSLLYDREPHQYYRLTAAESFLLCAVQDVPIGEALEHLGGAVGEGEAERTRRGLFESGWIDACGGFAGRIVDLREVAGAWGSPLVAHLGMTLACNFACHHCYSSSGKRAADELTFVEIEALIEQLAAMGCQKLVLGGGEPFLREDLLAVIRSADAHGIDCFVHTNGSKLSAKLLSELARCPPAALAVSLEGPDLETNDSIRGAHAFSRAMKGVATLKEHYPPGFNLSVTITPRNAALAPRMVELAHEHGAKVLLLRPAYPAGEAMDEPALVCDRDSFSRAIDVARARASKLGVTIDAPHPREQGVPDFEGFGCVAARVVLGIDPRGFVAPCLHLPDRFFAGNVRQTPLLELWRGGQSFVAVRSQTPNAQCGSCRHYDTCRGGCRVRSLFSGNGLDGPDSWCHYEPSEQKPTVPRRSPKLTRRQESRA